jgi:hypothetical protein
METERRYSFYRGFKSPDVVHRRGHCEFDCTPSPCDGEIEHYGELNVLKRYLMGKNWMAAMIERKKTGRN